MQESLKGGIYTSPNLHLVGSRFDFHWRYGYKPMGENKNEE